MANYNSAYTGAEIDEAVGKGLALPDDGVVGKTGNETVGGVKTFTDGIALGGGDWIIKENSSGYFLIYNTTTEQGILFEDDGNFTVIDDDLGRSYNVMLDDGSGKLPIAKGGTGASTASDALTALGAAPIASPALSGTPTAPTAAATTDDTQIATTAFVHDVVDDAIADAITYGTTDLTPGTSPLDTGTIYLMYE